MSQAVHVEVEDQTGVTFGGTEVREHLRHEYGSDRFEALDLYRLQVCDDEVEPVIADAMAAIEDGAAYLPIECNTPGGELDCQGQLVRALQEPRGSPDSGRQPSAHAAALKDLRTTTGVDVYTGAADLTITLNAGWT